MINLSVIDSFKERKFFCEEKFLLFGESLTNRVSSVYGTFNLSLSLDSSKNIGKGTYIGRFVEGRCVFGKRIYIEKSFLCGNMGTLFDEEGSFDLLGSLDGLSCRRTIFKIDFIKDGFKEKVQEFSGIFQNGDFKEGIVLSYSFCDGIHTFKGSFKENLLDGENCQFFSSSRYETGKFKEGKLIFGIRTTSESKQGCAIKEEGSFDPETGNLHGENCSISTATWSLKGNAIQGTIKNGQLTIHAELCV